jgi:hypothetical protein
MARRFSCGACGREGHTVRSCGDPIARARYRALEVLRMMEAIIVPIGGWAVESQREVIAQLDRALALRDRAPACRTER